MQDIRRPQTPLFWVFHLLSANEIDYVSQGQVVYAPTSMLMLCCRSEMTTVRLNRKSREYPKKETATRVAIYFLRKEQPSVRRALPPVGWHRTVVQPWQMTTVWACEKTVVMVKQPGHLTSMKNERGAGTRVW